MYGGPAILAGYGSDGYIVSEQVCGIFYNQGWPGTELGTIGSQTTNCHYGFTGYGPCMLTGSSSGINSSGSPDGKSQCGIFYNQVWGWDLHGGIGSLSSIIIAVN